MVKQETNYPWNGKSVIKIDPTAPAVFTVYVRIPGWARGKENPFDLYRSDITTASFVSVNGQPVSARPVNGYVAISRKWNKGDAVELGLDVQPRIIHPNDAIASVKDKIVIAAGPVVYGLEKADNPQLETLVFNTADPLAVSYKPDLLNGVNIINGIATNEKSEQVKFTAIPFYTFNNRGASSYTVWLPAKK